jgi:hypothetical protein
MAEIEQQRAELREQGEAIRAQRGAASEGADGEFDRDEQLRELLRELRERDAEGVATEFGICFAAGWDADCERIGNSGRC